MESLKKVLEKNKPNTTEDKAETTEVKATSLISLNESFPENTDVFDTSSTFESIGVCNELCEVLKEMGYKHPTKIQKETLTYGLQGRDLIGLAETGSGKTAAFGLPIIQTLLDTPNQWFYACILAPTRELCLQISQHLELIGSGIGLKTCTLVGGLDMVSQAISLSKKPHIIIGTPGRVADHLANTKGFNLSNLKYLVFDEADRLLDLDFEKQINQILAEIPLERTTFLFSATMTSKVHKLQVASLKNPVKVEVNTKYTTVKALIQNYIFLPNKYKETYLAYILNENQGKTSIVFVEKCLDTMNITFILRHLGFKAISINGMMDQSNRIGALNKFKQGERTILVATDVAGRGLDIPNVDLVINYDLPQQTKDYVHRVGRTARAGKTGRSLSFVTQYDVENIQKIEHLIEKKLELYPTEEQKVLSLYEKVLEAIRAANNELKELTKTSKSKGKFKTAIGQNNDEGGVYETFLQRKRNNDLNSFKNKSFVKKKRKF